jgi:uncharacterized membrane protein YoaK (UPF0700 family)
MVLPMSTTTLPAAPTISRHTFGLSLLAACTGAGNVVSVTMLGGAVSSVITGNLVVSTSDLASERLSLIAAPAIAIVFFLLGTALWSAALRDAPAVFARSHRRGLRVETMVLALIPVGLAVVGGHPGRELSLTLLAAAALAMGAQSAVCLRGGIATTLMTGSVAAAVHDLAIGAPTSATFGTLRRVVALVGGAAAAALLLPLAWWATATLPVALLAAALMALPVDDPAPL